MKVSDPLIIKQREKPLELLKLEALTRRLPDSHIKMPAIIQQLGRVQAGYRGEQSIDYPLSFLPLEEFLILHNLRLHDGLHYFQLDTVIISSSYVLILEVKNISGIITFDPIFSQLIRTKNDSEEGFPDPLLQLERQKEQLTKWILTHIGLSIEIEGLIVMANDRSVIRITEPNHKSIEKIIPYTALPMRIKETFTNFPNPPYPFSPQTLAYRLLKSHKENNHKSLERFNIKPKEIVTGVRCPECSHIPMIRKNKKWQCTKCGAFSKNAHIQALHDFGMLIDYSTSNYEARKFLRFESRDVVKRLLTPYKNRTGRTKGMRYNIKKQ